MVRVEVTGNFSDGTGNPDGGYFTFEQSHDLLVTDTSTTPSTIFRVPKRLVGDIPTTNTLAWNEEGSGKIHLFHGFLDVILMANDNEMVTVQAASGATTWCYHVKEYFQRGKEYDIVVPSTTSPVDINSLIVDGTIKKNRDWNRGY